MLSKNSILFLALINASSIFSNSASSKQTDNSENNFPGLIGEYCKKDSFENRIMCDNLKKVLAMLSTNKLSTLQQTCPELFFSEGIFFQERKLVSLFLTTQGIRKTLLEEGYTVEEITKAFTEFQKILDQKQQELEKKETAAKEVAAKTTNN